MSGVALFVFLVLAGARLGWLWIEDAVMETPRDKVSLWANAHNHPKLLLFSVCPWCIAFWIQVVMVAVLDLANMASFPLVVLWPFAINMVAAPLHHLIDKATKD